MVSQSSANEFKITKIQIKATYFSVIIDLQGHFQDQKGQKPNFVRTSIKIAKTTQLTSLIQYKVVRYENLVISMWSAVCLLISIFRHRVKFDAISIFCHRVKFDAISIFRHQVKFDTISIFCQQVEFDAISIFRHRVQFDAISIMSDAVITATT